MDVTAARRASSAAQALLQETEKSLIIDGKFGAFTYKVFKLSKPELQAAVESIVTSLGFPGGVESLYAQYTSIKATPSGSSGSSVFDLQIVPAMVREGKRRGVNPAFPIAQLVQESEWGKRSPLGNDGKPSLNFAGLKWNSVLPRTARKATSPTWEVVKGKRVSISADFAAFDTPSEFAKAYYDYVYSGPSSYRYPGLAEAKTALQYGNILQKGGYATDPNYGDAIAKVAKSVERRYAIA